MQHLIFFHVVEAKYQSVYCYIIYKNVQILTSWYLQYMHMFNALKTAAHK